MLWRRPERAHPPIVPGRKWTFAAASRSDASARVIQSAGVGIYESPEAEEVESEEAESEEAEPEGADESLGARLTPDAPTVASRWAPAVSPSSLAEPDDRSPPAAAFAAAFVALADPRSFFAQPLPLNKIAGAAMAFFRACEWQLGHWIGPWSWRPCLTSSRWPHAPQT